MVPNLRTVEKQKKWVRENTDNTLFETTANYLRVSPLGYVWVLGPIYIPQDKPDEWLTRYVWERATQVD